MAFEDADVLHRILSQLYKDDEDVGIELLLRRYEAERLPRVKRVHDNQRERYEMRMGSGRNPGPQSEEFMTWHLAGV